MELTSGTMQPLAITGVSHIEFLVTDLEASSTWYQQVVGLVELPMAVPERRSVELTPAAGGVFSIDVFDPDGHVIELIFEP